jgi:hypothetical protein
VQRLAKAKQWAWTSVWRLNRRVQAKRTELNKKCKAETEVEEEKERQSHAHSNAERCMKGLPVLLLRNRLQKS